MDKVLAMLQLQQQLNDATNGENWEEGVTKNGKAINWKRCIYMECAEMVDSFAWKHWKSIAAEPDWDNLQIEVVDVWHFVMSLALETYKKNRLGDIVVLAEQIYEMDNYALLYDKIDDFESEKLLMIQIESVNAVDQTPFFEVTLTAGERIYTDATGSHFIAGDLYQVSIGALELHHRLG